MQMSKEEIQRRRKDIPYREDECRMVEVILEESMKLILDILESNATNEFVLANSEEEETTNNKG